MIYGPTVIGRKWHLFDAPDASLALCGAYCWRSFSRQSGPWDGKVDSTLCRSCVRAAR